MLHTKYQKKHNNPSYFRQAVLNACLISIFQAAPQLSLEWSASGVFGEFQFEQEVIFLVS
ncbi:hypothetical protein RJD40_16885 [Vibrio scophthalmi]|uniref:hypothetical protein n=1 Tax=Vibrio scophthalmi TaxID=45658 RepID=UPI003AABBB03